MASKCMVPPHLGPLRIRRCLYPRPPCRDCFADLVGNPRRSVHRAETTAAPSSRTDRGHSKSLAPSLHGPTCTHACQASVQYLACTQTMASKNIVPPHQSRLRKSSRSLRIRRCRCPRPPCRDCFAGLTGGPTPCPHRAAPTETPSSRTDRGHSSSLHGPNMLTRVRTRHDMTSTQNMVSKSFVPRHLSPCSLRI